MIKSIVTTVVLILAALIEYKFSYVVKKSRALLHIYSIIWLIVYLGMFATSCTMTFHLVVRVFILLVTGGLGVRASIVYHTPMYRTKDNADLST